MPRPTIATTRRRVHHHNQPLVYNNRAHYCYKSHGGTTPLASPATYDDPDDEATALHTLSVAQVHELNRRLPPLEVSHEDATSDPGEVSWGEFVEWFQHISDDADAMQDDLLPSLERAARQMAPSPDKDALLHLVASYHAKLVEFFEVLGDIEADMEMLAEMLERGVVDVARVDACIVQDPPPDDAGNWDVYVELTTLLRRPSLTAEQARRLIADTRLQHGDLRPIGLKPLLEAHYRSLAKWEANIDAWNSVLEESQHHASRHERYLQACRLEHFEGTQEQYERGLRIQDAAILRELHQRRSIDVDLAQRHRDALQALAMHDPSSPEYADVQQRVAMLRSEMDASTSQRNRLHASLSAVSFWEHLPLDNAERLHDLTSDYQARLPKHRRLDASPVASHLPRTATITAASSRSAVEGKRTTSPVVRHAPIGKSTCECRIVKTKPECENKPGCKWRMGIGCRRAANA